MNPEFRTHTRRSTRKQGYDYSSSGYYFITIVVKNRVARLGKITEGLLTLSSAGEIVKECWLDLQKTNHLTSQAFVVMPNHFHGIIQLPNSTESSGTSSKSALGEILRMFKAKSCRLLRRAGFVDFEWQRNYYDHIIRTEKTFRIMQLYILTNPILWNLDPENPNKEYCSESIEVARMQECGFETGDMELIKNYIEFQTIRKKHE